MNLEALLSELFVYDSGDFGILDGQNTRQRLDDRDLGSKISIEAGEFDSDRARPDDEESFWHFFRHHRFFIGPDPVAIRFEPRERSGTCPCGQNDAPRFQLDGRFALGVDGNSARPGQSAKAVKDVDPILLHQMLHARRQAFRNLARSLDRFLEIE